MSSYSFLIASDIKYITPESQRKCKKNHVAPQRQTRPSAAIQQYSNTSTPSWRRASLTTGYSQTSDLPDDGIQPDLPVLLKKKVSRQP